MRPYPSSASRGKHLAPIDTSSASPSFTFTNGVPVDHTTRNAEVLARDILQVRLYGILPSLYASSIWCCDHYRLHLSLSLVIILTGAFILWHCYPPPRSRRVSAAPGITAAPEKIQFHTVMPPASIINTATVTATTTTTAAAALSATTGHLSLPPSSVQTSVVSVSRDHDGPCDETGQRAAETQDLNLQIESNTPPLLNNSLPSAESPLPAYPPPPYRSKCNSPYLQGNSATAAHWPQQPPQQLQQHLTRIRLLVHGLGAAGAVLSFGLWTIWLKSEAPLGHEVSLLAAGAVLVYAAMVYRTLKLLCSWRAAGPSSDAGSIINALQDAQEESLHSSERISRHVLDDRTGLADAHHGDGTDALVKSTLELQKKNRLQQVCSVRRSSSSPTLTSPTTFSMLQEVKSEFRLWALSFFVLAPSVHWSIGGAEGRCSSVNSAPRGLGIVDLDEHEYDMIQKREAYGMEINAAQNEGGAKRPRGQDGLKRENTRPSKDHVHKRGQSESVTGAITRAPSSPSTISKLARIHLDSERLGGIFQYYRRRQAAANSKDSGGSVHQEQEQDTGISFVVRSSTLPTVRVGLYGAAQKRLWSSTGTMNEVQPEIGAD